MKKNIVILCCAAVAFVGCQPTDEGMDGTGTGPTVTEPSGAERPMRDGATTNDTSGALGADPGGTGAIQNDNTGANDTGAGTGTGGASPTPATP